MLQIFLTGFVLVALTILLHSAGTFGLMRYLIRKFEGHNGLWRSQERGAVFIFTSLTLLTLHFVETLMWAGNYLLLHDIENIPDFESAAYFSLVTFTTLGYGDITLEPGARILSGIEAMNGVFLLGWSTALFFAIFQRTWSRQGNDKSTA